MTPVQVDAVQIERVLNSEPKTLYHLWEELETLFSSGVDLNKFSWAGWDDESITVDAINNEEIVSK